MIASQLFFYSEEKKSCLLQFLKSVKQVSGFNCFMLFPRMNVEFSRYKMPTVEYKAYRNISILKLLCTR